MVYEVQIHTKTTLTVSGSKYYKYSTLCFCCSTLKYKHAKQKATQVLHRFFRVVFQRVVYIGHRFSTVRVIYIDHFPVASPEFPPEIQGHCLGSFRVLVGWVATSQSLTLWSHWVETKKKVPNRSMTCVEMRRIGGEVVGNGVGVGGV